MLEGDWSDDADDAMNGHRIEITTGGRSWQGRLDREAEFVFLPRDTDWARIDNGIVFDVPNCELGHHGEDVSFNSILKKYKLADPALVLLGEIVRAADSHPSNPHAAGEGLRWIAGGFGKLGLSDHEILEREFVVYDALYAECKRQVTKA